jgi:hypothetical protein
MGMAQRQIIARIPGMSTTGQRHDLLIERTADDMIMVTVLGADGKKRHASAIILPGALTDEVQAEKYRTDRNL